MTIESFVGFTLLKTIKPEYKQKGVLILKEEATTYYEVIDSEGIPVGLKVYIKGYPQRIVAETGEEFFVVKDEDVIAFKTIE